MPALIALSAPVTPAWYPGIGDVGLDPWSLLVVFSAAVPATGRADVTARVPGVLEILGTPISMQGLVASTSGLSMSPPATVVPR